MRGCGRVSTVPMVRWAAIGPSGSLHGKRRLVRGGRYPRFALIQARSADSDKAASTNWRIESGRGRVRDCAEFTHRRHDQWSHQLAPGTVCSRSHDHRAPTTFERSIAPRLSRHPKDRRQSRTFAPLLRPGEASPSRCRRLRKEFAPKYQKQVSEYSHADRTTALR